MDVVHINIECSSLQTTVWELEREGSLLLMAVAGPKMGLEEFSYFFLTLIQDEFSVHDQSPDVIS